MESAINDLPEKLQEIIQKELKNFPIILLIDSVPGSDKEILFDNVVLAGSGGTIAEIYFTRKTESIKLQTFSIYLMENIIKKFKKVKRSGKY